MGKIIRWDRMVDKLKKQFIPMDYGLDLLKKLQGLKQRSKSVKEYKEEFYKIIIRTGHAEANKEKVAHYLNGLCPCIQEELNLVGMASIEEAYQFALKINKRFEGKEKGKAQGSRGGGRSFRDRNEDLERNEDVGTS